MSAKAAALVERLKELAKQVRLPPPNIPRSGDEVAIDQLAVFGELLVVLAQDLDKAQRKIELLTWAITALTAFLVIDAVVRWFVH
jgi:hypothetical protein